MDLTVARARDTPDEDVSNCCSSPLKMSTHRLEFACIIAVSLALLHLVITSACV